MSNLENRKPTKREFHMCISCEKPILEDMDGIVIVGNIYVANTNNRGGIAGNNFPTTNPFNVEDVAESPYHWSCLIDYIEEMGITQTPK